MSGSLLHPPARIIARLLVELAIGTDTSSASWRVFVESTPDSPDEVITVYDTAPILQGAVMPTGETQKQHGIMIQVRSGVYPTGWAIVNSITTLFDSSVDNEIVVVEGTSFNVHAMNLVSGPFHIGQETTQSKRELFTINYTTSLRQLP